MIAPRRKSVILVILLCIIFTEGIFSSLMALNRLSDVEYSESETGITIYLVLAERPEFLLKQSENRQIIVSLLNTIGRQENSPEYSNAKGLEIMKETAGNRLDIVIRREEYAAGAEWSWLDKEKILKIVLTIEKGVSDTVDSSMRPVLKGLLFGFREDAARMVMALDHKPLWEIKYSGQENILLSLSSSSRDIEDKEYEHDKWLKEVTVTKKSDTTTDISLQCRTELNHTALFWMAQGQRLVMDLYNVPPANKSDENMTVWNSTNRDTKKPDSGGIARVRMKIPEVPVTALAGPGETGSKKASDMAGPVVVSADIDHEIQGSEEIREISVRGMEPEEAALSGRIKQAEEMYDYRAGITLINQFLKDFPESDLIETLCFRRGDFYYALWRDGDTESGKKVIQAYQYAVDRFSDSISVPWAYIKMAQAGSEQDSFQSLAYLSIVINQRNGSFIPLAHLIRGKIYMNMGQPEKAMNDFRTILDKHSNSPYINEAKIWTAAYYHGMGLYEESEKRLRELAEADPEIYLEYPEFLLLRARNCLYLKDYNSARSYLFRAVNIGGQQEDIDMILSRIGDTYHNQKNEKEAQKYYQMVVDYYPDTEGAAIAKLRLADYFSDITMLEDLITKKKSEPVGELALLEKGYQLFKAGQYSGVLQTLEDIILLPTKTQTRQDARNLYTDAAAQEIKRLYEEGLYLEINSLYESGKEMIKAVIDPSSLLLVAKAYAKRGFHGKASDVYELIKPYDLNSNEKVEYFQGVVASYSAEGRDKEAVELLKDISKKDLDEADLQRLNLIRADIYRDQGMTEEAFLLYKGLAQGGESISSDEKAGAFYNMGIILKKKRDYAEARSAINQSISLATKSGSDVEILRPAYKELGDLFRLNGESNRAVRAYEKCFELGYEADEPEYWETRYRLALAYIDLGDSSRAGTLLTEISEEGDPLLQRRAEIKLGSLDLAKQLQNLSIGGK